jgi:hypothetical protein
MATRASELRIVSAGAFPRGLSPFAQNEIPDEDARDHDSDDFHTFSCSEAPTKENPARLQ